ncbi:MAG: hypothetical protein ACRECW_10250 [Phyllobacterium sp.]
MHKTSLCTLADIQLENKAKQAHKKDRNFNRSALWRKAHETGTDSRTGKYFVIAADFSTIYGKEAPQQAQTIAGGTLCHAGAIQAGYRPERWPATDKTTIRQANFISGALPVADTICPLQPSGMDSRVRPGNDDMKELPCHQRFWVIPAYQEHDSYPPSRHSRA